MHPCFQTIFILQATLFSLRSLVRLDLHFMIAPIHNCEWLSDCNLNVSSLWNGTHAHSSTSLLTLSGFKKKNCVKKQLDAFLVEICLGLCFGGWHAACLLSVMRFRGKQKVKCFALAVPLLFSCGNPLLQAASNNVSTLRKRRSKKVTWINWWLSNMDSFFVCVFSFCFKNFHFPNIFCGLFPCWIHEINKQ